MWVILLVPSEEAPYKQCHLLIGQDIPEPISCHDNHIILLQCQLVYIQHSHLQVKPKNPPVFPSQLLPGSFSAFLGRWKLGWATLLCHLWDGEQEGLELDVGVQDSKLMVSQPSGDSQRSQ